ncbi:hypothetical protein [Kitasatospora sp. NPDC050543]|uniref:hypothetical protein n=1 Tax=Kitasatospora sp. NPDC050543 TaxID=3364054 RepID=UPI0037A7B3AB
MTILMSDTLTDTTAPGTDETTAVATAADATDAHGRHRGRTAADDSPEADPHGRHRLDAAHRN